MATSFPWLMAPFAIFKGHYSSLCFHHHLIFSSASASSWIPLLRTFMIILGLCDYTGLSTSPGWSPHHEILHLIPFTKIWYHNHRSQGLECGHIGRGALCREVLFYNWGNRGSKRLSNFHRVRWLLRTTVIHSLPLSLELNYKEEKINDIPKLKVHMI